MTAIDVFFIALLLVFCLRACAALLLVFAMSALACMF